MHKGFDYRYEAYDPRCRDAYYRLEDPHMLERLRGEWDLVVWISDEERICIMQRNAAFLTWCGYISVDSAYEAVHPDEFNVHGGVTYGPEEVNDGTCPISDTLVALTTIAAHLDIPPCAFEATFIGFDCAHGFDRLPTVRAQSRSSNVVYRSARFVRDELIKLSKQLGVCMGGEYVR